MNIFSITIPMFSVKHHGGTRIIIQLANSLVEKGHKVTIIVPKDKYNPIYPVNKKVIIKFVSKVGNNNIFYIKTLIEFIFKIPKSDFILANFFPTLYSSFLAEKMGKGKTIYFVQDSEEVFFTGSGFINWFFRFIVKFSVKMSSVIIVTTHYGAKKIKNFGGKKNIKIINIGLPDGVFFQEKKSNFKFPFNKNYKPILYFPRIQKIKRIEDFLKSLEIIIKKRLTFELWLVSKEIESLSYFKHFKSKIKIKILTPKNDEELRKIYSSAYLLVNSSWVEGFCLPVLEAMACGTPSVITDSKGPREYAINNYNCLIVPPKNPELLAQAIEKMLIDEKLRNKLAANALRTAEKFKFSNFAEEFENFLINLK